ncbi:MAG: putative response regulator of a two component system [Acidobacteriaceae bacterium]|jgi:DNA-binding response OmpR family regulator|nr:putative response regulator of a two component system [Acidobacteriaceae bacterium]
MITAPVHTLCFELAMSPRVLLVDDDASLLPLFSEILSQEGYTVVAAPDGPQAELRAAVEPPFDLLITDYNMPGVNGVDLALRLNMRQPGLPVLLITGEELSDLPTGVLRRAGWHLLLKPIGCRTLIATVRQLLPARSSRMPEIEGANPWRPPPKA